MFDLGWPELLVIAIVLIVVVGPKDLPRMLRTFGRTTSKLRAMAGDFRKQFDEALSEAELDDVKGLVEDARKLDPRNEIRKHLNPIEKVGQEVRAGLDAAMKPSSGKPGSEEQSSGTTVKKAPVKAPDGRPATRATTNAKKASPAAAKTTGTKAGAKKVAAGKPRAKSASKKPAGTAAKKPTARKNTARKSPGASS